MGNTNWMYNASSMIACDITCARLDMREIIRSSAKLTRKTSVEYGSQLAACISLQHAFRRRYIYVYICSNSAHLLNVDIRTDYAPYHCNTFVIIRHVIIVFRGSTTNKSPG